MPNGEERRGAKRTQIPTHWPQVDADWNCGVDQSQLRHQHDDKRVVWRRGTRAIAVL